MTSSILQIDRERHITIIKYQLLDHPAKLPIFNHVPKPELSPHLADVALAVGGAFVASDALDDVRGSTGVRLRRRLHVAHAYSLRLDALRYENFMLKMAEIMVVFVTLCKHRIRASPSMKVDRNFSMLIIIITEGNLEKRQRRNLQDEACALRRSSRPRRSIRSRFSATRRIIPTSTRTSDTPTATSIPAWASQRRLPPSVAVILLRVQPPRASSWKFVSFCSSAVVAMQLLALSD